MTSYESVWDAIMDTPADAERMKARSGLLIGVAQTIKGLGLTRIEAAKQLNVTQSRLNDLLKGRISKLNDEDLLGMAAAVDLELSETIELTKRRNAAHVSK